MKTFLFSCVLFAAARDGALPQAMPQDPKTLATVDGITVGPGHVPVAGTADADPNDFKIVAQPPAAIAGIVTIVPEQKSKPAPKSARVPTVRLTALDPLLGSAFEAVQDDDSFVGKGVEAGRYRVDFTPPGQRIISAGMMRANQITNGIAKGRFTKQEE